MFLSYYFDRFGKWLAVSCLHIFFLFFFLSFVLRQEHGSGVEVNQPVMGNLCCMEEPPRDCSPLHSAVSQGQVRANQKDALRTSRVMINRND